MRSATKGKFWNNVQPKAKKALKGYRVLSLFSGAGGLDIGFEVIGFNVVGCVEIDRDSCRTLEANRGSYVGKKTKIFHADITKLSPKEVHKEIGEVDFIIGGPPCQSFSAAGRRAGGVTGINDTRGSLFWYYCEFLKEFEPRGFLFENVRGILQANKSKDWLVIQQSFAQLGYNLSHRILDAAAYEVPQHRERVILVGTKGGVFEFPRPVIGPDSAKKETYISSGEAFEDIDDPNELVEPYGGKYGDLLPDIPPGMNYSFYTEKMRHPEPRFAWRSKFSGFLYKLNPEEPSKTLVASQGRYGGPFHWKNRKLTVQELKRIQGFPDDYEIVGGYTSASRQIGNSVAPLFGLYLARAVAKQIFHCDFPGIELIDCEVLLSFDKRKGKKAQRTKMHVEKNFTQKNQLQLFEEAQEENIEYPTKSFKREHGSYDAQVHISEGVMDIVCSKSKASKSHYIAISLGFIKPIGKVFDIIEARIETSNPMDVCILWDVIHSAIGEVTTYESLQPLYGHFTEPYPMFKMEFQTSNSLKKHGVSMLLHWLSDFTNLSKVKSINELSMYMDSGQSFDDFVMMLRANRFDIRTHETNRAIPDGCFKFCYPFTLFSQQKTYTPWIEVGNHKTGDLRIVVEDKEIVLHELNNGR